MSYRVRPDLMLFDDLTDEEAAIVLALCESIVLRGIPDLEHPAFKAWCEVAGYDHRQRLLVMSTAFPQRALLSIVRKL